jgi:acetylornithine deacetylase/succinyl-diaminopimelate desuccinylase-like protein
MLVSHAMIQPPATMPDPYGGTVIDATSHGLPGEAVLGKGASEQKGTMAAMLHAIEAVRVADIEVAGRLVFVYGNHLQLQLGNRGRVDVKVIVHGKAGHSSRPNDSVNAVTGAKFTHPRFVELIDEQAMPLNGAGKIDRQLARQRLAGMTQKHAVPE